MRTIFSREGAFILSLLVLALVTAPFTGFSGEKPGAPTPILKEMDGFAIKLVRISGGSYGYEIRKGGEMLVRERRNPFTGSEAGLASREDAMKTATWLVNSVLKKEQALPPHRQLPTLRVSGRPIPATVARELGITIE